MTIYLTGDDIQAEPIKRNVTLVCYTIVILKW